MTTPKPRNFCKHLVLAATPLLLVLTAAVHAQTTPSQMPLLSKPASQVRPNIMLTLDDSGSMSFRHMPEDKFAGQDFSVTNPVGSNTVRWDPSDSYQTSTNFKGTVPGNIASANWVLKALRSPDTNTIFYNPEIRYQPWLNDDGLTRRPNSPVTTAYLNPPLKATTATSVTAIVPATGSKLFTLAQTGKSFAVNDVVIISSTAAPTTNWMIGTVTAFNSGTGAMTVNVTSKAGAASLASWNIVKSATIDLTDIVPTGTFPANALLVGKTYTIVVKGTTSWTSIGAANNNVGTVFTATAVGTGTGTASGVGSLAGWCYANAANVTGNGTGAGGGCEPATGPFNHDPGVYFRLNKTAGVFNAVNAAANYTAFTINAAPATTYTKSAARLDCAGATCTRDEERQNFANWYTYYRDRNLFARGSLMESFGPQATVFTAGTFQVGGTYMILSPGTTSFTAIGSANNTAGTVFTATGVGTGTGTAAAVTFRLGFGRINKGSAAVDTVNTTVLESDTANYGGGGVRDFGTARKVNLFKWLEDLPASGGTPLVEAMDAVGRYYSRTDNRGPWTDDPSGAVANTVANNKTCRRSYNIMTTDGYWTGGGLATPVGNADNTAGSVIGGTSGNTFAYSPTRPYLDGTSNTLADVAMYYWKTDLQPSTLNKVPPVGDNISFWQNMTNYTVGLGVRGTLNPATDLPALTSGAKVWPAAASGQTGPNIDDLWHAAVNSRGKFFSVKDPKELSDAVKSILAATAGTGTTTAGVATAAATFDLDNRKYVPGYIPGTWSGDIEVRELDRPNVPPVTLWKASDRMPSPYTARNIVTWDSGLATPVAVPFTWASMSAANRSALGPVAALYTTQFVDYLRGDHSLEGTFRSRINAAGQPFVLGDFINGNPVLVRGGVFDNRYTGLGLGTGTVSDPTYSQYQTAKAARTSVLFAGSNDGMLHGFKDTKTNAATDGQEVFAYVPRAVYANLYKLTDTSYGTAGALQHQFFVDGPLQESDAYVKAPGASTASWRNYLTGSLGAGGRAVFALDVTDLANLGTSSVRWELSSSDDSDLGYVMTPVQVGVLPNGRWVAVFGNGSSSTSGNAVLFVVDLEDAGSSNVSTRANAIKKLTVGVSGNNGLGGILVTRNSSGQISKIFGGDLQGSMWRFDYNAATASKFEVAGAAALFTATDSGGTVQPITATPTVYAHTQGGNIVLFGTGKLVTAADALSTSVQSVYAVWDKPAESLSHPLARSVLASRTLTTFSGTGVNAGNTYISLTGSPVTWTTQRGWYIDLGSGTGNRVIYPVKDYSYDTALVSVVAPVQGVLDVCDSANGSGYDLYPPVESGTNPGAPMFDTNGDGKVDNTDAVASGYVTAADGINSVVSSAARDRTSDGDCTTDCDTGSCTPNPACPANTSTAIYCVDSVQTASLGVLVCKKMRPPPVIPIPPGSPTFTYDRMWRRIINPPIR